MLLCNPMTENKGAPHQAFIWCCATQRSGGFFTNRHVGFEEGWSRFPQVTGELPTIRPGGVKVHVVVNKLLAGLYIDAVITGRLPPVAEKPAKEKKVRGSDLRGCALQQSSTSDEKRSDEILLVDRYDGIDGARLASLWCRSLRSSAPHPRFF